MAGIKGDTISTGSFFNRCVDSANKTFQTLSFWHKASDCEFNDGTTAESKLSAIKGITTNTSVTAAGYAADASVIASYIRNRINSAKVITFNGTTVNQININGSPVWYAGNNVTYRIGTASYTEFVTYGQSCLSPKTVTPVISGWTFVGWREDTAASPSVLSSKVMGTSPVTLYAVFSTPIYLYTVVSGTTTTNVGYRYYNTGNYTDPVFTVANPTISDAVFNGWSASAGSTVIANSSISNLSLSASAYRYAVYTYAANSSILKGLSGLDPYNLSWHYGDSDDYGYTITFHKVCIDGTKYSKMTLRGRWFMRGYWGEDDDGWETTEGYLCNLTINGNTVLSNYNLNNGSNDSWNGNNITDYSFDLPYASSVTVEVDCITGGVYVYYAHGDGSDYSYIELTGRTNVG